MYEKTLLTLCVQNGEATGVYSIKLDRSVNYEFFHYIVIFNLNGHSAVNDKKVVLSNRHFRTSRKFDDSGLSPRREQSIFD